MRISHLLLGAVLFAASAGAADVYKWTGPDGRVHFGDRPPVDTRAEEVRIRSFRGVVDVAADAAPRAGVTMLSTTWCGVCKQARRYFEQRGIPFTELDVEKTDAGRAEYKRLNGRGVPIIIVGGRRMNGFSAESLEPLLKSAGY